MDLNSEGKNVLESNILIAAQRIQNFLIERRERRARILQLRVERGTHGVNSALSNVMSAFMPNKDRNI